MPTPNTNIILLQDVPLDETYRHSIYWTSAVDQFVYFGSKRAGSLAYTQCMYHRDNQEIRVDASVDACEHVNYVMYQNDNYGDKWFYAFVTERRFINSHCTGLKIKTDILQTYFFDYQIPACFIERQHSETDNIGDNTIPENLDIGDYVVAAYDKYDHNAQAWSVVMYSTFDPNTYQPSGGSLNLGMYSALSRTVIGSLSLSRTVSSSGTSISSSWITDPTPKIRDIIQNHADLVEGVVAIVLAPSIFESGTSSFTFMANYSSGTDRPTKLDTLGPTGSLYPAAIWRYKPKNAKLYTAPYTRLYLENGNGEGKFYDYEKFGDDIIFEIFTDRAPAQSLIAAPVNYNGYKLGTETNVNFGEMLTMTGFPQCAWVSDAFQTYLAQNQTSLGLKLGMGVAQVVGGIALTAATSGAGAAIGVGTALSGLTSIASILAGVNDQSKQAPKAQGNITGTGLLACVEKTFTMSKLVPKADRMRSIDDYFTMFGYAQRKVAVPNIAARPHWTYIKTINSLAVPKSPGGCAADILKGIQDIYDMGITFWKNPSEIGDYSLNNSV